MAGDASNAIKPKAANEETKRLEAALAWERKTIMYPLQTITFRPFATLMWFLGLFMSVDFLVPSFALLYWALDQDKCLQGIWLVPVTEISNGLIKWHFRRPRPGWVDPKIDLKAWSNEYSFPSSHSQLSWALSTFFVQTSTGFMRSRMYGPWAGSEWGTLLFAVAPFVFAACVSLARVYEGVHYPRDIVVGALLGVATATAWSTLLPLVLQHMDPVDTTSRIACLVAFSLTCLAVVHLRHSSIGGEQEQDLAHWIRTAARGRHKNKNLNPHGVPFHSYTAMCGVLAGLGVGIPAMIGLSLTLALPTDPVAACLRVFVGLVVLFGVYIGIEMVEKKVFASGSFASAATRFLRYASVPPSILIIAPLVFHRFAL